MLDDWMLIRDYPDFLILPLAGLPAERKRRQGRKSEVQGLWAARSGKDLYQGMPLRHAKELRMDAP
jgi:hypothetical protein